MIIDFLDAKNGEKTVKVDSIFLHSSYNPSREAENFVKNISVDFVPEFILITEPGLAYSVDFLKKRFPQAKIIVINYLKEFEKYSNADYSFLVSSHFENEIQKILNESNIFMCLFLKWEPSSKVFTEIDNFVWEILKKLLEKFKTLLITRQYFEKKWLLNSLNFIKYLNKTVQIESKIELPVFICASGPSLNEVLPILRERQNQFFIICLSSAVSVLKRNKIIPDLYMSTDGGFWANYHLRKIEPSIPLALPCEGYCNKNTLITQTILPLFYEDGFSNKINKQIQIDYYPAERNGTVSGTALQFAQTITDKEIFFAGLDLYCNKEFQHTNPNELQLLNSIKNNRINTQEISCFKSSINNESLKIYENWFKSTVPKNCIYRIISNNLSHNNLNRIKDITPDQFYKKVIKTNSQKKESIFIENFVSEKTKKNNIKKLVDYFTFPENLEELKKEIFPMDYLTYQKHPEDNTYKIRLESETKKLLNKITGILNE